MRVILRKNIDGLFELVRIIDSDEHILVTSENMSECFQVFHNRNFEVPLEIIK